MKEARNLGKEIAGKAVALDSGLSYCEFQESFVQSPEYRDVLDELREIAGEDEFAYHELIDAFWESVAESFDETHR